MFAFRSYPKLLSVPKSELCYIRVEGRSWGIEDILASRVFLHRNFRSSIHESTIMLLVCLRFCVFLLALSLPVYQNAHVNSVCEKIYSFRCLFYFQCSTVNIYKYKRKYLLRRIPHASYGSYNRSLSRISKHTSVNVNITVVLRSVTFFSHTSEPLRTGNTFVDVLIVSLL